MAENAQREITLREWVELLPASHLARREYDALTTPPAAQVQQDDEYLAALDDLYKYCDYDNNHWLYQLFLKFVNTAKAQPAIPEGVAQTLRWYADARNYYAQPGAGNPVRDDIGNRARQALVEAALIATAQGNREPDHD